MPLLHVKAIAVFQKNIAQTVTGPILSKCELKTQKFMENLLKSHAQVVKVLNKQQKKQVKTKKYWNYLHNYEMYKYTLKIFS